MVRMSEVRKRNPYSVILVALVVLVGLPILLIAVAIFEEEVIGSHYTTDFYRELGIFGPLDWLFDTTVGRFVS